MDRLRARGGGVSGRQDDFNRQADAVCCFVTGLLWGWVTLIVAEMVLGL